MTWWWWCLLFVFEWIVARHVEKIFWIVPGFCLLVWGMVVFIPLPLSYSHIFLQEYFFKGQWICLSWHVFCLSRLYFQMELLQGKSSDSVFAACIIFCLLKSFCTSEIPPVKAWKCMNDPGCISCSLFLHTNAAMPWDKGHVSASMVYGFCREGTSYCAEVSGWEQRWWALWNLPKKQSK